MAKRSDKETSDKKSRAAAESAGPKYVLRLYVAGKSRKSVEAIRNLKNFIKEHLNDSYDLEVIDIYQQPIFAKNGQIVAAPTLVKELPLPLRKFIGDLSNTERLLAGLDLDTVK
jgi:circadian clock protein KaiB